jgi:hypothetical protein
MGKHNGWNPHSQILYLEQNIGLACSVGLPQRHPVYISELDCLKGDKYGAKRRFTYPPYGQGSIVTTKPSGRSNSASAFLYKGEIMQASANSLNS